MKRNYLALVAMLCCGTGFAAEGQRAYYQDDLQGVDQIAQVGFLGGDDCGCEVAEPTCGCEGPCDCPAGEPTCGMEFMDGGCDSGCDSGCGSIFDSACECNLGDPLVLFGECGNFSVGGWASIGYHTAALPLFNSKPSEVQLHQAWLFAEKALDTECGFDIGGRIDYIYGTDGPDTQAFGIDNDHWDNSWETQDQYGHAIPQLYAEAGYGDWSVKAGHFYTTIGWEVVQSTGNFFYSHAYTMYNSEPFTHTGALATFSGMEKLSLFGGYVMGWDSGFEDNGDAFLGGATLTLSDDVAVTYSAVGGIFANNQAGLEKGYMHSIVADVSLTDNLQYVFQSDLLSSENRMGGTVRDTFGVNQYLIRTINDCLALGGRFEWYNAEGTAGVPVGTDADIYALTLGVNYKPHANVTVRPEIRWDWDDSRLVGLRDGDKQTTFGIDSVITF
ncbi:hypothetical protein CA13_48020 [Planctomycetes bacterium CA13]|uniref:Porin n=1 Tax=Novipirellula herctigrandis TaxID=2527986 RepID=A0A5C5Z8A5_9BACT|nr:hypothetical protein CA13_48020 [Planctomycetes bacterium CA13]